MNVTMSELPMHQLQAADLTTRTTLERVSSKYPAIFTACHALAPAAKNVAGPTLRRAVLDRWRLAAAATGAFLAAITPASRAAA
jgi:hypothetical protein